MRIHSLILAEAIAQDAEGIFSLVRIGQNVFTPAAYPAQTKRAIVLHLVEGDDEENDGSVLEVSFSFKGPSGDVLMAQTLGLQVGAKRFPELPGSFWVPVEAVLTVNGPGAHIVEATVRQAGAEIGSESLQLFVVEPSAAGAR